MTQEDTIQKVLTSIQQQTSLTSVQVDVISQHLEQTYCAGYDEATTILLKRPRKVEQWYMGVLIKIWDSSTKAANELYFNNASITRACVFTNGKSNLYKGYNWRYL